MRRTTRGLAAAAGIAGSAGFGGAARATALVVGNTLTNGPLTFTVSSCTYQVDGVSGACGSLQMLTSGNGVQITGASGGNIFSETTSTYRSVDDLQLDLSVATSAGTTINGASVAIAGSPTSGTDSTNVRGSETIYDQNLSQLGSILTATLAAPTMSTSFVAQAAINLSKDFGIFATPSNNVTDSLASITETFSVATSVPEPGAIMLLSGFIGVLGLVRRRRTA